MAEETTPGSDLARMKRELRRVGRERVRHREKAEEMSEQAKELVIALRKAGVSRQEIVEISGYHDRAVGDILSDAGLTRKKGTK